jgi:hypothetical protein
MDESKTTQEPPAPTVKDPLAEIKAKLTDIEKENFFKAFLADKPYIAEESFFQGKATVKFKTLTIEENNAIMVQMAFDRETGVAENTDKYLIQVIQYRIAASLLELDKKPFATGINIETFPINSEKHTTYILERLKLMKDWQTTKISSLTDAFNRFEKKVRALTEESFKENF